MFRLALDADTRLIAAADWSVCAVYVWVMGYPVARLLRRGLPAEGSITAHAQALAARFDEQSRVLRTSIWWGYLPVWGVAGFACVAYSLEPTAGADRPMILGVSFVVLTAAFAGSWWKGERRTAQTYEARRDALAAYRGGDTNGNAN
jgi:hypothetical protein